MVTKGEMWRERNQELGINMYRLLHIRWVTNKDLLYSTGKSAQYSVITCMRKEPEKEYIYICITESFCNVPETNTKL